LNYAYLQKRLSRGIIKALLNPLMHWSHSNAIKPGFSIILGTPVMLRELLPVNLEFIRHMDLQNCDRIHIVFDRRGSLQTEQYARQIITEFPDLPIATHFHPNLPGRIVEHANRSKFFASLNWVTGINACTTKYAILHDFDLYPHHRQFFQAIVSAMKAGGFRFSGSEHTPFDGLTKDDGLIGTWELGVDVEWLRLHYRPIDCFHAVKKVRGRWVDLDAFSAIQACTPERALAEGASPDNFSHIKNLCSTYLKYNDGRPFILAWRLHCVWYLQFLSGRKERLSEIVNLMLRADAATIEVDGKALDFSSVHVTCSNVLDKIVNQMDRFLHGEVRREVEEYLAATRIFLERFGDNSELL